MYGKVTGYFKNKGYGFIQGRDGHSYFIHVSGLNGEYIKPGYYVHFDTFANEKGKYNAKNVIVIEVPEKKRNCSRKKCGRKGGNRTMAGGFTTAIMRAGKTTWAKWEKDTCQEDALYGVH